MMENIKEIPYGIANFVEVAEQNMYYVDKTMYLPLLEKQPRNLFFIRPRHWRARNQDTPPEIFLAGGWGGCLSIDCRSVSGTFLLKTLFPLFLQEE